MVEALAGPRGEAGTEGTAAPVLSGGRDEFLLAFPCLAWLSEDEGPLGASGAPSLALLLTREDVETGEGSPAPDTASFEDGIAKGEGSAPEAENDWSVGAVAGGKVGCHDGDEGDVDDDGEA